MGVDLMKRKKKNSYHNLTLGRRKMDADFAVDIEDVKQTI